MRHVVLCLVYPLPGLQSSCICQQALELLTFQSLQIRVATDVLLLDENVWHGGLASLVLQISLDVRTIVCAKMLANVVLYVFDLRLRTNLVELDSIVLGAQLGKKALRCLAVWTVRLGEDSCVRSATVSEHTMPCTTSCYYSPTAFSEMMASAFDFAAPAIAALVELEEKKRRKKEMLGGYLTVESSA